MKLFQTTFKISIVLILILTAFFSGEILSFCGFYVAKADGSLFNRASQVVLARDGERTVLTMTNDFEGDFKEFAIVIPVPTVITEEQVHIGNKDYIGALDAFSAPRLVEYFDEDPCAPRVMYDRAEKMAMPTQTGAPRKKEESGVTIEAQFTVGEYDILILSAKESNGLENWLNSNGYKIPKGASQVLESYIKQNNKFFVAKVNLKEQSRLGFTFLRPIQVAFESPKFMLPIRLGTLNAKGDQEIILFTLTRNGRVESTNYRNVKIPANVNIPVYTKQEFGPIYKKIFEHQVEKENKKVVFTEFAWDTTWCDPCVASPPSLKILQELGAFWTMDDYQYESPPFVPFPTDSQKGSNKSSGQKVRQRRPAPVPMDGSSRVFLTRLHVVYNATTFPDDLAFQETGDSSTFQARYVLQHQYTGQSACGSKEWDAYKAKVVERQSQEAKTLADLSGLSVSEIRKKIGLSGEPEKIRWWKKIWK